MKYQQTHATKRPKLSLRYDAVVSQLSPSPKPVTVIPPAELRRLVAAMID
jgi:hypothetical protein